MSYGTIGSPRRSLSFIVSIEICLFYQSSWRLFVNEIHVFFLLGKVELLMLHFSYDLFLS